MCLCRLEILTSISSIPNGSSAIIILNNLRIAIKVVFSRMGFSHFYFTRLDDFFVYL